MLAADFRHGLPAGWSVLNGELGTQVMEADAGILFPPQPPNQPKGSIAYSSSFATKPGQSWSFTATTKGSGLGGGWVDWRDANDQPLGAYPFAEGVSADFAAKTSTVQAPAEAASWRVWFGVDTFGSRVLQSISVSSLPGS